MDHIESSEQPNKRRLISKSVDDIIQPKTVDDFVYSGSRLNGVIHGFGTKVYLPNSTSTIIRYEGRFNKGLMDGIGWAMYVSGATYDGHWKSGKRDGTGRYREHDGCTYTGIWKDDVIISGIIKYTNGNIYTGEILDGKRHGMGIYQCTFNPSINVQRSDDLIKDLIETKLQQADLSYIYNGSWDHDLRHGYGHCVYNDLKEYMGDWDHDERHGYGIYQSKQDIIYTGTWDHNKIHGDGSYKLNNGKVYAGKFQNGLKHGFGIVRDKLGKELYHGVWDNDKLITDNTEITPININTSERQKDVNRKRKYLLRNL